MFEKGFPGASHATPIVFGIEAGPNTDRKRACRVIRQRQRQRRKKSSFHALPFIFTANEKLYCVVLPGLKVINRLDPIETSIYSFKRAFPVVFVEVQVLPFIYDFADFVFDAKSLGHFPDNQLPVERLAQ